MLNNSSDKLFSTDNLDDAMKELLDICQQYNDKISKNVQQSGKNKLPQNININDELRSNKQRPFPTMSKLINDKNNVTHINAVTKCDKDTNERNGKSAFHRYEPSIKDALASSNSKDFSSETDSSISGSVEMLQQRQCEIQSQLDEVLEVAKDLELKQKKKLNVLLDESNKRRENNVSDDEDSELVEFQQIENELRISELNRQLSNIQEELRLRLYKRLLSKTSASSRTSKERRQYAQLSPPVDESPMRRDSTLTNESTPPSSSCSNENTATSCISSSDTNSSNVKPFVDADLISHFEKCLISTRSDDSPNLRLYSSEENHKDLSDKTVTSEHDDTDSKTISNTNSIALTATQIESGIRTYDLKPALKHGHDHDNMATDSNSDSQNHNQPGKASQIPVSCGSQKSFHTNFDQPTTSVKDFGSGQAAFNSSKNCLARNDLGRIDEGEEDDSDYYANSNVFRSIYEEKISPMMKLNDYRFNPENINSAKRSNRPLTMYMPQADDDDVDLVKLVQLQGHDLDIISADLKLTSTSAHGYLYKSCSSNSKKWLKRYFYFDWNMKTLSYYENEEQLVKKSNAPKRIIPFDEIGDVYVDHRLSELSEKQKGQKRKSYVFILSTIKRKYVLASSKAETMRAWIDILFKAARANDYFNNVENDEYLDSLDPL